MLESIEKAKEHQEREQASLDRLKAENLHLRHAISMCDRLLQLGYNIQAIERIVLAAEKYGEPLEVLKAMDYFGGTVEIEAAPQKARDYDKIKQERDEATTKVLQLEAKVADYAEVKRKRDEIQAELDDSNRRYIRLLEEIFLQQENPKEQRNYGEELANSGLPELVEKHVENAVTKRLKEASNKALTLPFTDEVQKQAQKCLRLWLPSDLGPKTPQKVKMLEHMHFADPFVVLKGHWQVECLVCNLDHTLKLDTVHDIRELLIREKVQVPSGTILSSLTYEGGQHMVPVQLKDIIKLYIRKALRVPVPAMDA